MAVLAVFSILYGALVAMAQTDFKKLVAYSSVSHMGYVTLGMAVMNLQPATGADSRYYAYGVNGAMFMMLAHGITSAGMFFLVGVIYDRAHTRDLNKLGGLNNIMPLYGAISYIIFFGSMGLPGLCGFVAEVFVVLAAFNYTPGLAVLAAAAVILTAGYILWTVQRVFLGKSEAWKGLPDMNLREIVIAVPLVVLTIAMGIFPQWLILSWMSPSVDQVAQKVMTARELNVPQARPAGPGHPGAPAPRRAAGRLNGHRTGPGRKLLLRRSGRRCTLRATSDAARGNRRDLVSSGDCPQSSGSRRESSEALGREIVRLSRSRLLGSRDCPRASSRAQDGWPTYSGRSRTAMRARSWMAALALIGASSILHRTGISAQAPGRRRSRARRKRRRRRRTGRRAGSPKPARSPSPGLSPRSARRPRRNSPPSSSTSPIAGLGTDGCDVEVKPANAELQVPAVGRRSTSPPTARPRSSCATSSSAAPTRRAPMAITVREPGQPPQTIYRGFRPGSSKPGSVPSFTCFVSSRLAGVDAKATRK